MGLWVSTCKSWFGTFPGVQNGHFPEKFIEDWLCLWMWISWTWAQKKRWTFVFLCHSSVIDLLFSAFQFRFWKNHPKREFKDKYVKNYDYLLDMQFCRLLGNSMKLLLFSALMDKPFFPPNHALSLDTILLWSFNFTPDLRYLIQEGGCGAWIALHMLKWWERQITTMVYSSSQVNLKCT